MERWGANLYGDPCTECGYDWSMSTDDAIRVVADVPVRYTALLIGTDGSQRHPDLAWTAGAYACHVNDNLPSTSVLSNQWCSSTPGEANSPPAMSHTTTRTMPITTPGISADP